jgi:hypothetical protein
MAKVTKRDKSERIQVSVRTKTAVDKTPEGHNWWRAGSKAELARQVVETAVFIKEQQNYRYRQASIHARMYGNLPLSNFAGGGFAKTSQVLNNLPVDRPTMNVVQSCVDTLVSRIAQSKPKPLFLTDGGDYKARTLSKQMNTFIGGELYQTKAYDKVETILRDASILGSGCLHVFEKDKKVALERVLATELLVDANDAFYGEPRSMYRLKLIDRSVLRELFPTERSKVERANQATPDDSQDSTKTISDQVLVVEAWHLKSGEDVTDGRHTIACDSGLLFDEPYDKQDFPFVFIHYSPRLAGFWAQGLTEQLTGTQIEINKLLITISQSISLVGVPRVFVEDGSKVVKAHLNNQVGSIVTYRGEKPTYEVAPCVPQELYAQLQRLIEYAYQQSGISALSATSQKPAGLNSGEAIRNYDDLQSDRFATLNKRYDNTFVELAYKIIDKAKEICERDGEYQTVYPNKDGTKQIDLPAAKLLDNPFVIQCFDSNALPKDPAGRKQAIVEDMQSGILTLQEGRRLLNYSDLEQDDKLAIAAEERILKILDDIVESGKYVPPDEFIDLQMAKTKVVQYYNLYLANGLEESKAQLLREWQSQLLVLEQAMLPPPMPGMPGAAPAGGPMAVPQAPPTSDLMPINPAGAA